MSRISLNVRFPRFHFGTAIALGLSMLCMSSVPVFADGSTSVSDCTGLQAINDDLLRNYVLTADIDCTGVDFVPMGDHHNPFSGIFDGGGHVIRNLSINIETGDSAGLFAFVEEATIENVRIVGATQTGGGNRSGILAGEVYASTISNVGIEDFHMASDSISIGGLVGYPSGSTISKVYVSSGTVVASTYVGGVVGILDSGSMTDISSASVTVTGSDVVGGLIGEFYAGNGDATLTNGYADAAVTGGNQQGGAIGRMFAGHTCAMSNVFSVGNVSGPTSPGGLVGKKDSGCTIVNSAYNHTAGNPAVCVGTDNDAPSTACTTKTDNASYFYNSANEPLLSWNFDDTWSEQAAYFPLLAWQPDSGPPDPVADVSAEVSGTTIALTWTNPANSDFQGVRIRRSTIGYPTSVSDGTSVASGVTGTFSSDENLGNGTYYYSLFALDQFGNVSTAATVSATVSVSSSSTPETGGSGGGRRGGPGRGGPAVTLHPSPSPSPRHPKQVISPLEQRTCTRVLKWFADDAKMLGRVNARLQKRFGFTCGGGNPPAAPSGN